MQRPTTFRIDALGQTRTDGLDLDWLWRGYLAPGQLTLLTSRWKSGKTTLLSILLARLRAGGELLGMPVRPGRALVISEESPALWRTRDQRLSLSGNDIQFAFRPFPGKPDYAAWSRLVDYAGSVLGTEGGRLLVIDTVATLMPAGVESNPDCVARALAPLRQLADAGVAVWLMHHPRKGKLRAGESARGTGSLPASVDISLEMHPCGADFTDCRRVLLGYSRHEETPRRRVFEWTEDRRDYRVLPDTTDPDFDRGWSAIRKILADSRTPNRRGDPASMAARLPAAQPGNAAPLAGTGRGTAVGGGGAERAEECAESVLVGGRRGKWATQVDPWGYSLLRCGNQHGVQGKVKMAQKPPTKRSDRILDKRLLQQKVAALQARLGLVPNPSITGEDAQAAALASGVKAKDCIISREILRARRQKKA